MSFELKNASLDLVSSGGSNNSAIGAILITGNAGGTARYDSGASHPTRGMIVIAESGSDVYINIGAAATGNAIMPVLATQYLPLPYCDTNLIYVQSASGKKLYILTRD